MKHIVSIILLFFCQSFCLCLSASGQEILPGNAEEKLKLLEQTGLVKYGKADASGTRELLMLKRDNTGVFMHQPLLENEGEKIEEILAGRGLIKFKSRKNGSKPEKHIMVFNPSDKNTFCWIPLSDLIQTADNIARTGKTLKPENKPRRLNENDFLKLLGK